jgi:drug/metabolite transporter (DMT)-like permease
VGDATERPGRWQVIAALGAVYVIWGSTYLAIQIAIETLPPFLMAGARFGLAGVALYLWARLRGASPPARAHWPGAAVVGACLLLGGNGGVVWAEQFVPSGLAALLVSTLPLWMVGFDWLGGTGERPSPRLLVGLAVGLFGILLLVGPEQLLAGKRVHPLGALVLIGATASWALGSIASRRLSLPESPVLTTGMEMMAGGAMLFVAGLAFGEPARFHASEASARSLLALGYLFVFGSLIAFSAYIWLLRAVPTGLVSTYAYVNPVVAVILGWALAGEELTPRTILASTVIISAVAFITTARAKTNLKPAPVNALEPAARPVPQPAAE